MNQILSEAAGIFAGDGTLYKTDSGFVLEVRGPPEEEKYYRRHVSKIFSKVFCEKLEVRDRNCGKSMIGIRKSSKIASEIFHKRLGFPIGSKERTVAIPKEIINSDNRDVWIAYLLGVFDTDGCVSLTKNRKSWFKPVVDIGSVSFDHRLEILFLLERLGFNAHLQRERVRIGGWSTVDRFFKVVKPHNHLKVDKWQCIINKHDVQVA